MIKHPFVAIAAAGSLAVIAAATGMDDIVKASFWRDHGTAIAFFGADLVLLFFVLARWWSQHAINAQFHETQESLLKLGAELEHRLGVIEGIAEERGRRIILFSGRMENLAERTVILRDCDEEHERRIIQIEDKLRIARDRAAARLALRGEAFKHDGMGDPEASNNS